MQVDGINMPANVVVVGAQWGDEGKGKVVDVLAEHFDIVARYQGGANAGHTVYVATARNSFCSFSPRASCGRIRPPLSETVLWLTPRPCYARSKPWRRTGCEWTAACWSAIART